jgi:hypothetical protein
MTLRFIDFKTSEPQNTEPQPATSPSVASSGSNDSAESNFEEELSSLRSQLEQWNDGILGPLVFHLVEK